jgi:hypothetical protein
LKTEVNSVEAPGSPGSPPASFRSSCSQHSGSLSSCQRCDLETSNHWSMAQACCRTGVQVTSWAESSSVIILSLYTGIQVAMPGPLLATPSLTYKIKSNSLGYCYGQAEGPNGGFPAIFQFFPAEGSRGQEGRGQQPAARAWFVELAGIMMLWHDHDGAFIGSQSANVLT